MRPSSKSPLSFSSSTLFPFLQLQDGQMGRELRRLSGGGWRSDLGHTFDHQRRIQRGHQGGEAGKRHRSVELGAHKM